MVVRISFSNKADIPNAGHDLCVNELCVIRFAGEAPAAHRTRSRWKRIIFYFCVAVTAISIHWNEPDRAENLELRKSPRWSQGNTGNSVAESQASRPLFEVRFFDPIPDSPSVHASSITCLPNGGMMATWFGGTREGAKDVSIFGAHWDAEKSNWEKPVEIVDAQSSARELRRYIRKVGNPVLYCSSSGRLWLYYVTVSVGGWSGSSINTKYSDDCGKTWSRSSRLFTSPFMNISTLVRSVPLEMSDGSMMLPVYHEFIEKYGEVLHLSPEGELIAKYRMGNSVGALQPTLSAVNEATVLAFHRRADGEIPRVLFNRSLDAGQTWSDIQPIDLPNPNASVAVVKRNGKGFLMALNASESERLELSLAVSDDGVDWRNVKTLPATEGSLESSYPTLIKACDGTYHLTYTWGRKKICHVRFNDSWLEQSL
jgi:predicted neuraminidase